MNYAELDKIRSELVSAPSIWQFDLLKPHQLAAFVKDRGIAIWGEDTIEHLWRCGLLRADKIRSTIPLSAPALNLVGEDDGVFNYADLRQVPCVEVGYGGIFQAAKPPDAEVQLLFHPFRLFVLYHVDRVFASDATSTQYLLHPPGLTRLAELSIEHMDQWTKSDSCAERFEHWNRTAELAIVAEPSTYGRIFHATRWRPPDDEDSIEGKIAAHREKVRAFLTSATPADIDGFCDDLVINAESIDDNKMLHVLLRLTAAQQRLKFRSAIGGSMFLLAMAETIRRAAEHAHDREYPEEDERGFGQWMEGARKSIYGTERILDAPAEVRRDFLTSMGLDAGVKVRVYVEGDTEEGAMRSAAGEGGGVEYINLRGQVIEKKQLAFVASLKADMKSHVLSIVMLDGDSVDNVRALKKAAKDKAFFGRFFVATPDFEFGNFTASELIEVALKLAEELNQTIPENADFSTALAATSGTKFLDALEVAGFSSVRKSAAWGRALMKHALRHPEFPAGHSSAGKRRPAVDAARLIVVARGAGYQRSVDRYDVDPDTGEFREKLGAPE